MMLSKTNHGLDRISLFLLLFSSFFITPIISASCKLKYGIKDEFGDEASILREGGTLEISCGGSDDDQLHVGKEDMEEYYDRGQNKFLIPINTRTGKAKAVFEPGDSLKCKCEKGASAMDFRTVLCQHKGKACDSEKVCVQKPGDGPTCEKWDADKCNKPAQLTTEYPYVCFKKGDGNYRPRTTECEALGLAKQDWATLEVKEADSKVPCKGKYSIKGNMQQDSFCSV